MHVASQSVSTPTACAVGSHALFEARLSAVSALRDRPAPAGAPGLQPRFLRHCDEQTVVGVHAVLTAMAAHPLPGSDFSRYGVVAASCQAGQIQAAKVLAEFGIGGSGRVSPHIIPQCSLHSIAGAVSVALGMHGPNVGAGGGPDAIEEGILTALTLMHAAGRGDHPGIWLVVSEWDPEPTLKHDGTPVGDPLCRALAIALEPAAGQGVTISTHFPAAECGSVSNMVDGGRDRLTALASALSMCRPGGALVSWGLASAWGAQIRVSSGIQSSAGDVEPGHATRRKAA